MYTAALMAAARLVWPDCGDIGRCGPGLVKIHKGKYSMLVLFVRVPFLQRSQRLPIQWDLCNKTIWLHLELYDEASAKIRWRIGPSHALDMVVLTLFEYQGSPNCIHY